MTASVMSNLPERDPELSRDRIAKVIEDELRLARELVKDLEETLTRFSRREGASIMPIRPHDDFRGLRPLDGALKLLKDRGSPIDRKELESRLDKGNCKTLKDHNRPQAIKSSLSVALKAEKPLIKELNGRVGLPGWPDEKFET
jgi:hypothetical protein